jgi:hypothetical protein
MEDQSDNELAGLEAFGKLVKFLDEKIFLSGNVTTIGSLG